MKIKKVLIANRGEIAIRVSRACVEMGLKTVGIYTYEDRYSLHRYKCDESYQVGADNEPLKPYLDMDEIIFVAKKCGADAIHPGYGFLSENEQFARKCAENGIIFIGPRPDVMQALGDKVAAKTIARKAKVPVIEDNREALVSVEIALAEAARIGYPIMVKAAAGGGGRGMRVVQNDEDLVKAYREAKSEAAKAFGDDTLFLEKFVARPRHIEVQIMGDQYGNLIHLFERDCSVQRRFQKVVEVAPSVGLPEQTTQQLYEYAVRIASEVKYNNVGTVEFLVDEDGSVYFIEVNPRIQVEHTVTEMITGTDLVKCQIYIAAGYRLSDPEIGLKSQKDVLKVGFALQCRITTEDPENDFRPDYGTVIAYRSAGGFGIRLDGGSIYPGVKVSPFFDSLLTKVSAHAKSLPEAAHKMIRCLQEFRIRGVKTNMLFLENILRHPTFFEGKATVNFVKDTPELFKYPPRKDSGTKVLKFLADVSVNGNPDVKHIDPTLPLQNAHVPFFDPKTDFPESGKKILEKVGPDGLSRWLRAQKRIHFTDTTLRDGHQSLLATRVRTIDMVKAAESFARAFPQTFSMEVWGGATFDVCLRFLHEDPWKRLALIRQAAPNMLLQMLLRGSNAVGYAAYPDNLIEAFVEKAGETGIDIFRIFDSLNWVKAIEPSITYVRKRTQSVAEAAVCYTGNILDGSRTKYNLAYYVQMAKDLENAGAHIIAIKDMAGLLKPEAAKVLVEALRDAVKLPIHLHTHDASGLQLTTYMKAIDAGVDVVDVALASMSSLTSQPSFNSLVEMLEYHERENPYDKHALEQFSLYWETVRDWYYPFESGMKAPSASVYHHEMPGGQYSNLKRQALELGIVGQWDKVVDTYAEVNLMFGDIVKVTPSSKVVGDMALWMVSKGLSRAEVMEKGDELSFPESVKAFFRGDLGQPHGGIPAELQKMVLKDEQPYTDRPNKHMKPVDLTKGFKQFQEKFGEHYAFTDFLSWHLYPKVFEGYHQMVSEYGDIYKIPTRAFLFGMKANEETTIEIAQGKTILVELLSIGEPDLEGMRRVFFKLNGQNRNIKVQDKKLNIKKHEHPKADPNIPGQIGSPLQGLLSKVFVKAGQAVEKNAPLFIIEAMKMENTVVAPQAGKVVSTHLQEGTLVNPQDWVVTLEFDPAG